MYTHVYSPSEKNGALVCVLCWNDWTICTHDWIHTPKFPRIVGEFEGELILCSSLYPMVGGVACECAMMCVLHCVLLMYVTVESFILPAARLYRTVYTLVVSTD